MSARKQKATPQKAASSRMRRRDSEPLRATALQLCSVQERLALANDVMRLALTDDPSYMDRRTWRDRKEFQAAATKFAYTLISEANEDLNDDGARIDETRIRNGDL